MVDKLLLKELYIDQNLNQSEIAEKLGLNRVTIMRYLKKYQISKKKTFADVNKIIKTYNLKAELHSFIKVGEQIEIKCSCGKIFKRYIHTILKDKTCICHECSGWKGASNGLSNEEVSTFIKNNGCTLLSVYHGIDTKLTIKCKCKAIFEQTFHVFKKGEHHGCPKCFHKKKNATQRHNNEDIQRIVEESGCKWLSGDYKNLKSILGISCFQCGEEQPVSMDKFIYQHKIRCKKCSKNRSSYELYIIKLLEDLKVEFLTEKNLEGALGVNKGRLRFDFVILEKGKVSKVIEVDGQQHYKKGGNRSFFNDKQMYEDRLANDRLKNDYCRNNNIPMLRIPFKLFTNTKKKTLIENELRSFLFKEKEKKSA